MLARLWLHRPLILSLVRRQYHVRYRQSFAGLLWALVAPLATLGVGVVVFQHVAGVSTGKTSYVTFTLAGLMPWTFFASSLTFGIPSVSEGKMMITRLAFPRAALPLGMIGISLLDLCVATGLFVAFVYGSGETLPPTAVWSPLILLIELLLIVGLVLLGSAVNVFARDVRLAVPLGIPLWLFLTPVMYPFSEVRPALQPFYLVNPMTGIVESFRDVLVDGHSPDVQLLLPAALGALGALALGTWYFKATESRFADVI